MPLTTTVDEAIAAAIYTRMGSLADSAIVRRRKDPETWTPEDRQIVLVKRSPERRPELDYPGNPPAIAFSVQVNLRLHIVQSEEDEAPTDTLVGEFVAQVMKHITDQDLWYRWGDLAINTEFGTLELVPNDGGFDCAVVALNVTYRFSETNPYEVRA